MAAEQMVVISGPSGCGKSVAAKALEDCGFFVVDNFPPQLFGKMIELLDHAGKSISKIGFVIDAREQSFLSSFPENWQLMLESKRQCSLLYLDASDEILINRFKQTRRRHPLDDGGGIKKCIKRERQILEPLANLATHRINTDEFSVHRLGREVKKRFTASASTMMVTIMSFGFKYGVPSELDTCFDVRFLDNPYFVEELRDGTGLDEAVAAYVFKSPTADQFVGKVVRLLKYLIPLYLREGKSYLTIAIGCTGGRHRAPAITEKIASLLGDIQGVSVGREHRDIARIN